MVLENVNKVLNSSFTMTFRPEVVSNEIYVGATNSSQGMDVHYNTSWWCIKGAFYCEIYCRPYLQWMASPWRGADLVKSGDLCSFVIVGRENQSCYVYI